MEQSQGLAAALLHRRRAPILLAVAALYSVHEGAPAAWAAAPSLEGHRSALARPWTGDASRARTLLLSNVMEATPPIRFEDDDERFVAPKSRRIGAGVFGVARALSHLLLIFGCGAVLLPIIWASLAFVKRRDPVGRKLVDRIIHVWSKAAVWPFFRVTVKGRENLPPDNQAVVYVANHQSFMDILSSYHLSKPFKFVSKASITKIPVVGQAMKAAKTITIEREDRRSQMQAFRTCVDTLKAGTSIFVFPEGTRSPDGSLINFKKGPFSMARRAGVPMVPITIKGTNAMMPSKKEYLMYTSKAGVELVVHPMVSAKEVQSMDEGELVKSVRGIIESALPPALRKPELAGARERPATEPDSTVSEVPS